MVKKRESALTVYESAWMDRLEGPLVTRPGKWMTDIGVCAHVSVCMRAHESVCVGLLHVFPRGPMSRNPSMSTWTHICLPCTDTYMSLCVYFSARVVEGHDFKEQEVVSTQRRKGGGQPTRMQTHFSCRKRKSKSGFHTDDLVWEGRMAQLHLSCDWLKKNIAVIWGWGLLLFRDVEDVFSKLWNSRQ